MVLRVMYVIELLEAEEGGLELVDPAWTAEHPETATSMTGTEFDVSLSDVRSEFSEYSSLSRKSPEEGTPRKKIKSPPGISPTGSSTSLYSGGSSIDWTTTGTTLEMQGTRVTRTQYGFRTLQESSAKMCLKVTGYPLPDITWYKDDQLLKEDERRTFYADEDGFFAMTIDPVQVTDTGRYTCVATNEYGQASTSAFFRVLKVEKEAAPPAFSFQLKDKEVKEGEVVSFECEVEGWPEPELVWMVDDQPLRPSQDFRLQYDGQNAKLEIRDAQPEDTGVYAVKITNEYGSQESTAKLIVQPDPDKNHVPPEFQAMIEDVECKEGDSVRFKAVITGDPDPEITWLVNGIPLSESEKIKFISEDGICILTIKDVSRHFDGLVTCQGKNRLGTATCDANLRVKVDPAPPSFDKPLEDRVITEKSSVMFECEVSGYPEPTVEFVLNGKPLANGVDGVEIQSRDGSHRVTITDANAEKHDGTIIGKATNHLGSAECRAKLGVEPPEEESRSAPTFIKDIEDQTVKSGEPASFVTIVRGNPNPHVTWHLNGTKLDETLPGIKIEANGADHKLSIIDSTKYAGTVLCRAENSIGRFETKARLIVLPTEKKKKAPEFLERLSDKSETEGATAVFEVRVDAEPRATFKWTLNGQELVESNRVHFRDFDGSVKIEISDIKLAETGTLAVTATNSEGSTTSEAKLTVNRKPCAPTVTEKPKNVSIERGQEAVFTAKVDGAPFPEVTWSIGGRKIRPTSDGAKVETSPDGSTKLIIDTEKFFENATITVTVESPQGTDEAGAQLNIEEPKKLAVVRDLTPQTVEKGNWAHYEAVITNANTVQWLLDGKPLNVGQDGVKISQDDKFEFRLTIDTSKFDVSTGKVTIKASNNSETIEKSTTLTVTQKPKETETPGFTDGLKDVTAELGKPLEVDVIALNEPSFEWSLNGQPLVDGQNGVHVTTEGNKSTLKIDSVGPEHAGALKVVAKNAAGTQESTAKLEPTQPKAAAKITTGLTPVSANEKESVEFSVTVAGAPTPTVAWNLNGQPITAGSVSSGPNGQHSLRLAEVTPAQSGDIKVIVTNELGSDESTAKLTVKPAEVKPVFKQTLSDAKVEEGAPLSFTVALDGPVSPSTKVNWYLNGKKLEPTDALKLSEDGSGKYTLDIAKATPDMNGTISVRAENPQGSTESKAKVEVTTGERGPEFSKTPADQDVEEQTSIKFSAIVTGVPYPEITWLLNDVEIVSNDEIRVKRDAETGKTSIRIFKPKIDQSGKVKIHAKNKLGSIESTAELKVSRKKEIPNFLNDFMDRQVNEGSDVKFQAKIEAYPEPEVTWTLNGQPLTADNVKTTSAGDIHTIEFNKVRLDQAGELACEAKNTAGHKKQNCTINVKEAGIAPNFVSNLTDRLVDERETVIMEATLNKDAKPPATISWFKDGAPLTDPRYKTTFDQGTGLLRLTLIFAELTDKSRISIKAENRWGAAESSASIGVTKKHPMAKPQFLSELAPVTITEGDSLETKVIITGDPKPYAKWYINNQMVYQTEDTEIKEVNGVYSLIIHGCSTDMTGTIKCVAGNRMGEATTEGKLNVIAPVPVEFETCLCDATCREGDTLKLKAVLLGEPRPDVTWYVNGKKLEDSQNIKIHSEKGTYTVTIKDITLDYSGKVVCEAINEFGKASSEATLIVMPRGEPPDFIEWLSNIRARQGSNVTHKVVFTGDPKPVLTWYINNREVKDGLEGITIKTSGNSSTLTIKNFTPEKHVGEIICKAENDAGEVSCTANMATYTSDMVSESESEAMADDVGGTDDLTEIGSDVESVRDEYARTPTPVMAPKFITKIKDTRASKGHQAVFECVVPDSKGVVCKWLKDGKEIELIARIRVQTRTIEGHVTSELIIDDVKPEDAGRYTVVVENAAGTERCEANLNVVDAKEGPKAPQFTEKLQDKQVKTGEKVVLECAVDGEPKPNVSWFKDEKKITSETTRVTIETSEKTQRLVIEKSEESDTSVYKCVAENASGKSSTEAKLEVRAPGTVPEFTRALVDKAVTIGEKVILECSVRGVPQPVVEFFKGSTRIESGGRFSVQQDATQTHWRLVINQTVESDLGEYQAEACNIFGVALSKSQVSSTGKVKEPEPIPDPRSPPPVVPKSKPEITQGLKAQKLKEGGLAEMEVTVSGNPQPDVEFFKDGEKVSTSDQRISVEVDQETGKHTLRIRDVVPSDAGEYSARAVSPEGTADSKAPLEVEAAQIPAKIVQGLRDIEVNEGDRIELTIKVNANPQASVTWAKNGEPVAMDGEHLIVKRKSDNEFQLILNKVRLDDESVYSAKAFNKLGSDETSAKVKIIEDVSAPAIVEKLKDTEVKEGQTLEVCVTVTGKPTPSVEFFRNGTLVNIDGTRAIHKMEGSHHTLVINEAKVDESGKYSAKAVNKAGSAESSANVKVLEDLQPPTFIDKLRSVEIKEGQFSELSVTVTGKPKPTVQWLKDGQPISPDGVHILEKSSPDFNYYSITIKNAVVDDSGTYTARATNKAGTEESSAKFKVQEDLERPSIKSGLVSKKVKEGTVVELVVVIGGKPYPDVTWLKNGQPIALGGRITEKVENDGTHTLVISPAELGDAGTISVAVVNKVGKTTSTCELEVVEDLEPTVIVQKLKSINTTEGQTVEFALVVTGKPAPKVEWFREGKPIVPDDRTVIGVDEATGRHTLTIKNAQQSDSSGISVKAANKVSSETSKATLFVGEHTEPPRFSQKLTDLTINESENAVFECSVTGKPVPDVSWFKDGRPVYVDNKRITEKIETTSGKRVLIISNTTASDVGTYSCQAVNKVGASSTKADLKINGIVKKEEPAVKPTFSKQLTSQTVSKKGENVVFEAVVDETTKPEIAWFKDGKPITPAGNLLIEHRPDGTVKLTVVNATENDVGVYKVEAFNPAGKVGSEAVLKYAVQDVVPDLSEEVHEVPQFVKDVEPQNVQPGEVAVLEAILSPSSDRPVVQWFKDDAPVTPSEHVKIEQTSEGNLKLTVTDATDADAGTYRVVAKTPAGEASSTAPINYGTETAAPKLPEPTSAPEFSVPLKPQVVAKGETVTFECKVNESAQPQIQWFRDNVPVDSKPNVVIEHRPDGTLKLTIRNVKEEDIGNYRCEAVNKIGKADTNADLKYARMISLNIAGEEVVSDESPVEKDAPETVKFIQDKNTAATERVSNVHAEYVVITDDVEASEGRGVGAPEFVELLRSALTSTGGTATLKCKVKGEPRPTIKWTRGGVDVALSDRVTTNYAEDGIITLTITNATDADSGEYRCEATNDYGSAWTEAPIILAAASSLPTDGEAPDFTAPVRPVTVAQGAVAVLEGKIIGTPAPEVKWYKGGKEIKKDDARYVTEALADGTQRLTVKDAQYVDVGEYRCEATNKWGDVWSDATLTVHAASSEIEGHEQIVPTFTQTLQETTAKENEHHEFEVMVGGEPKPEIKWFKDNKPIDANDAHFKQSVDNDGKAKLVIANTEKADAGKFTCEATNDAGKAKTEAPLHVEPAGAKGKPEKAPEISQGLKKASVKEGETVEFECKVDGHPPPTVKWFKDGEELKAADGVKIQSNEDGTNKLVLEKAKVEDQGNYRVEASSNLGTASSKAPLTVEPSTSLTLKKPLQDKQIPTGAKLDLSVEVEGQPKSVKWFKGSNEIRESSSTHYEKATDEEYKLIIEKVEVADTGAYRVVLANETQSIESSCQVTVSDAKPAFKKGLGDQAVPKGAPLRLEIEVDGKPKQVKWYKNGDELKPSAKTKLEDLGNGKYALVIPEVGADDFANYTVKISNDAGEVETSAKVTEAPSGKPSAGDKPSIVSGLKPQTVKPGERVVLEVEVAGPVKQVKWYKNGQELPDAQTEEFNGKKYRLILPSASGEDAGDYKVILSNDAGNADSSAALTVTLPADAGDKKPAAAALKFVKPLEDVTAEKGSTVPLEIELSKKPKQVKWYKNGKELQPGDKEKPKQISDTKYALEIPDVDADGQFKVVVVPESEDEPTVDSACALTVKLPPKDAGDKKPSGPALKFVKPLEDVTADKGATVPLEIELSKKPKQVKWYKNGKELQPGDKEKPKQISDTKYALEVPDVDADGQFKVVVIPESEDEPTVDSACALTVKLPPKDAGDKKPSGPALKFVKPLEDVTADKGATVPLEIELSKKPKQGTTVPLEIELSKKPKQVKWYKNGKELQPGDKEKPKQISDTKYALEVPDVDADGQFKVVVVPESEDEPTVDSSCALTVKLPPKEAAKPTDEAPKFVKGLVDQSVPAGDDLELVVTTSGSPKTVKWYKNGQAVPSSAADRIKAVKIDDNNYKLVIPKSLVDDSGEYAVEIENPAGKAKSTAKVTVTEPKLTFVKPLSDVSVTEGEPAEFVIETNAKPKTVKWYKNGQEVRAARGRAVISTIDDTKYSLKLINVDKDDSGEIKVVLSNAAGDVESTAKLTVTPKAVKNAPKILKGLEDAIAAVGNALIFEVKVEGDVESFKFLKDGQPIEKANPSAKVETVSPGVYKLTIPSAALSDAGTISFVASNPSGDAKSTANAEVDEKPKIAKALVPASIDEGDDHIFKVEVSAPVRTVKWYKNGQEVKPSAHAAPKQVSPKKFELTINKAQLDDGATWKVVLGNAAGECDSEAALTVTKPNLLKLLKGLTDADVNEGEPITLTAKIEGEPKSVKWLKNGKEVTPDDHFQISSNPATGEYTLTIPSAAASDSAAFRVVFANEKGEIQSGALAHVKTAKKSDAEKAEPAAFVSPLQDTEIEEGDTLTLKAKVSGSPQPEIKWYRNGQEIKPDGSNIVTRIAFDGTATLRILDSKKSDAGSYKIVATNPGATVESSCNVGVLRSDEVPTKPKFIVPLRSTDAPVGAKVEFNFKVRSVPPATFRFQIDGKELPVDGVRVTLEDMHDGNYTLTINDVQEEDFGTIRAVAENPLGKDECEAVFEKTGGRFPRSRDEEGYPPRFNVPLWDRRVPEGHIMFIECHVDAKPLAEVTWTKNGDELKPAQGIQIEYTPEGACRVKISDFNESHVGAYKCFAKNEYGTADTIANLNVEVISEEEQKAKVEYAPKFNPQLEDVILNEGGSLSLSCRVDAAPTAIVQLYKDGLPVKSSDKLKWSYDPATGKITLTVANVDESDGGAYRAVASNHLGSTNTACLVTVRTTKPTVTKSGEEPFFKRGLTDKYVDRGETLELICEVIGDPTPEIKWYRNGILLRPTGKITIETTPEGVCKLVVKDTTMSDEGVYRCEATNEHGKAKTQCTAHVEISKKREKTPIFEGEAPKFVQPLEDSSVSLKGLIELDCKVTGLPIPSLKWSKDGGPMIEDARFEWTNNPEKGIYSLRIRNATIHDEGTYRAVASNESGSATSKAMIRIDDGGKVSSGPTGPSSAPRISVRLADVRVSEGSPLKLECKIEGTPTPEIVWYKDGERVVPSERLILEHNPDTGMARLIIPSATLDDDGLYRVIATNPAGSAVDKCNATVKKSARGLDTGPLAGFAPVERFDTNRAPKVVVPLDNVRIPEKQPFKLTCKFSGDPKPSIKWYKDGERVYAYGRCQLKELPDGTCELSVDAASRSDGGMYRCVADNDYGSARTTCEVTVQLKDRVKKPLDDQVTEGNAPGFSIPLTLKRARAGETVVFECLPYGKPFPTIKWLKDGLELAPSDKIVIEALPDGTQRLTVADVDFLSEGYYRCVATNEYGTASTKADLTVSATLSVNSLKKKGRNRDHLEAQAGRMKLWKYWDMVR
uniref:Muscle M-line assembly protein unc-89 n=1 Tax=Panagrellus redivivus TaxID=6233 RepID=A0A7E4UT28_PANRE